MAVCSVSRYRCHGAGPALGALYGAVSASSSTEAGQPPVRYTAATRSRVDASVTRRASPSSTRSMPRKRTDTLHAGLAARLRDLSVLGPLVKYSAPSTHVAPTPAECGRPSGRTVATKNVRSASGVSLARISRGRLHGSSADPYRSRLRVEIGSVMVLLILVRRTGRPQIDTEPTKN